MRRALLLTIITFLTALSVQAQPACNVRTFTIRDGLASNSITSVEQGPEGLIWVATWNGLCCYDGYQFTTFRGGDWGSDDALSSYRISAIKPDSRGNVWLRTYDGVLYLFDSYQCRYINVSRLLEEAFGEPIVPRNFYTLPSGHTWITGDRHTMSLRIDDRFPTDVKRMERWGTKERPLYGEYIRKVETDSQGREWIITDQGMMSYDGKEQRQGVFSCHPAGEWKDSRGRVWTDDAVMTEDRSGTVWRLTREGTLSYYDEASQHFTFCKQLPAIGKWFIDSQHNLWFSSTHGLSLVNFRNHAMHLLPLKQGDPTRSILCRRDGTTWAGTANGYIGVYDQQGHLAGWLSQQGKIVSSPTLFSHRIYTMLEDSKGYTWIGTKGQGLYMVSPQGTVSHFIPDSTDTYSLNSPNIYDIDEDERGNIWIATYGGGVNLVKRQKAGDGRLSFVHAGNELKNYPLDEFYRVRRITHDGKGTILLSCTHGLVTYSNQRLDKFYCTRHSPQDTTSLRANDVMQTLVTRHGNIYVTTLGGSIQRLTSKSLLGDNLRFQVVKKLNQGSGNAMSMVEDEQGNIWIVRETEISMYQPKDGQLSQFGPNNMVTQAELTEAQPVIDNQGHIWMGTADGLLTFNASNTQKSRYQPHIAFTTLRYQGEQQTYPILNQLTLTIPKNKRNLTVNFAALDYEDNYLMQYAYRIVGKDDEWNYIGRTPSIAFSQLPAGRHTLVVKSTNCDGVWADNEAQLEIDVQPTLWERGWVRLLALLLAIALSTWATITYLRRRQQNREREQRLENILRQYRELQQQIEEEREERKEGKEPREYRLEEPKIVNVDEEMMDKLMKFIEQRIGDDGLRIEDMAEAVGLGRTVFYEKVRELVGISPSDFLRQVRMQRAKQLVSKSKMTISEIAYSVGFTDPKYFTKCFKKETGMTPSEYRTRI